MGEGVPFHEPEIVCVSSVERARRVDGELALRSRLARREDHELRRGGGLLLDEHDRSVDELLCVRDVVERLDPTHRVAR